MDINKKPVREPDERPEFPAVIVHPSLDEDARARIGKWWPGYPIREDQYCPPGQAFLVDPPRLMLDFRSDDER